MNKREMLKKHSDLVAQAEQVWKDAETAERLMNADEQKIFDEALTEAETLESQIGKVEADEARLKAAVVQVKSEADTQPIKPQASDADKTTVTRAEFDSMPSTKKAEFTRRGGRISE